MDVFGSDEEFIIIDEVGCDFSCECPQNVSSDCDVITDCKLSQDKNTFSIAGSTKRQRLTKLNIILEKIDTRKYGGTVRRSRYIAYKSFKRAMKKKKKEKKKSSSCSVSRSVKEADMIGMYSDFRIPQKSCLSSLSRPCISNISKNVIAGKISKKEKKVKKKNWHTLSQLNENGEKSLSKTAKVYPPPIFKDPPVLMNKPKIPMKTQKHEKRNVEPQKHPLNKVAGKKHKRTSSPVNYSQVKRMAVSSDVPKAMSSSSGYTDRNVTTKKTLSPNVNSPSSFLSETVALPTFFKQRAHRIKKNLLKQTDNIHSMETSNNTSPSTNSNSEKSLEPLKTSPSDFKISSHLSCTPMAILKRKWDKKDKSQSKKSNIQNLFDVSSDNDVLKKSQPTSTAKAIVSVSTLNQAKSLVNMLSKYSVSNCSKNVQPPLTSSSSCSENPAVLDTEQNDDLSDEESCEEKCEDAEYKSRLFQSIVTLQSALETENECDEVLDVHVLSAEVNDCLHQVPDERESLNPSKRVKINDDVVIIADDNFSYKPVEKVLFSKFHLKPSLKNIDQNHVPLVKEVHRHKHNRSNKLKRLVKKRKHKNYNDVPNRSNNDGCVQVRARQPSARCKESLESADMLKNPGIFKRKGRKQVIKLMDINSLSQKKMIIQHGSFTKRKMHHSKKIDVVDSLSETKNSKKPNMLIVRDQESQTSHEHSEEPLDSAPSIKPIYHRNRRGPVPVQSVRTQTSISIRLKPSVSRSSRNKRTGTCIFANQHLWLLDDPIKILSCSRCVQVSSELARLLCVKNNSSDSQTNNDLECPVKNTTLNEQLNELLKLSLQLKSLKVAFPQEHHVNFFRMSLQNLETQWSLISSKYSRTVDTTVKSNQASIGSAFFILGSLLTKMYDILIKIHVYRYTQGFNKAVEGCLLIAVYLRLYLESDCNPPFSFLKYLKQDREKVIDMLVNFNNVSDAVSEKIRFSEIHNQCKQRIAVAESHVDNAVVSALVVLKDIVMNYSCIVHNQPLEECEFENGSARTNVQIPTMEERIVVYPEKTFETTSAKRALLDMLFCHDSSCFTQPLTQHSLISDQAIEIYMLASNPSFDVHVDSVKKKIGILLYQKFQSMMQRYDQIKDKALRQEKKEEIMSILYQYYYNHVILSILKKRRLTSLEMSQMLSLSPGIDSVSDSSSSQLECSLFTKYNDNGTAVTEKIKLSGFNHTSSFVGIEEFNTGRKKSSDQSLQNSHLVSISPIKSTQSNHFVNNSGAHDTVVLNGPNNSRDSLQQETNLRVSSANSSYKNVHQVSTPLRMTSPNDLINKMIMSSNYPTNPPMPGWNVSHVKGGNCSEPYSNSVQPRPSASPVYVQSSTHSLQPSIPPCRPVVELSKHHIMNVIREKISTQLMEQTNIVPSCDTSNIVVPRVSLSEAGGSTISLSVMSPLTNARNLNDVSVDSNVCTVPSIVSKTSNVSISRGTAIKSQMIESCATKPVPIVLTPSTSKPSVSCSVQHYVNDTSTCKHQSSTSIELISTVPITSSIVTNTSTAMTSKGYTTASIVNSVLSSASIPETSDATYTRNSISTDSQGCSSTTPVSTMPSPCTTVVTKPSALEALLISVSSNHEKSVSSYHTSDYHVTSVGNKRAHPSSYTLPQVRSTPYTTAIVVPQVRSTSYTNATVLRSAPYTTATVLRSAPYTTATVLRSTPYTTGQVRSTPYTTSTVLRSAPPYTTATIPPTATVLRSTPYTTGQVRSTPYTTSTVLRSAPPYTTATIPPTATVLRSTPYTTATVPQVQSTPISTAPRKPVVCMPINTSFQAPLMPDARNSLPQITGVTLCPPPFTCVSSVLPCPPPIVSNILPPQTINKYANTPLPTAPNVFPFQYPVGISANDLYTLQQNQITNLLVALQNNLSGRQSVPSLNHIIGLLQSYNLPAINNIMRTMIPSTLHPNESRFNTTQVFCPSRQSAINYQLSTSSNCFTPPTSIMPLPNVRCTSSMASYTLPQPDSHTVSTKSCRRSTMNSSCSLPMSTVSSNSMRLPNNISIIPYIPNTSSTSSVTLSSSQQYHVSSKASGVTKTGLTSLPTIPPVYSSAGKTPSVSRASSGNIPTIVSSSIKREDIIHNYVYDVFLRNVAGAINQTSSRLLPRKTSSLNATGTKIPCSLQSVQGFSYRPNLPSMISGNSVTGNITINAQCKSSNLATSLTQSIRRTPLQSIATGNIVDPVPCSLQNVESVSHRPNMMLTSSDNSMTGIITINSDTCKSSKTSLTPSIRQTPIQSKSTGTTIDMISCSLQSVSHQPNPPSVMSISSGNSANGNVTINAKSSNVPKTSVTLSIGQTPLQSKATVDQVPCSIKNAHQPSTMSISSVNSVTINTTKCKSSNIPSKCVVTPSIPQTSLQSKTTHKQIDPDDSIFNSQWHSIIPFGAELQYRRPNERKSSIKDPRLYRHEDNPHNSRVETKKLPSQCTTTEPPMPSGEASNGPRLFLCVPSKPNHSNKHSIDSSNQTTITANAQADLPTQVDKPLFSSTQIETNKITVQDDSAIVDFSFEANLLDKGQHMLDVAANRSPSVSAQLHHSMDNAKGNDQHKHTCSDDAKISPLADPQSNQPLSSIEDPILATEYQENQSKSSVARPCFANGDQPTLINDGLTIIEDTISKTDYQENQSKSSVASRPCLANGDQPTLIDNGLSPSTNSGVAQSRIDVIAPPVSKRDPSNKLQSTITSVQHTVSDTPAGCTSTDSKQVTVLKSKLLFNVTVIDHSLLLKWGLNAKDRVKMEKDIECFDVCYAKLPDESNFTYDGCCSAKWTSMGVITPLPLPMSATLVNLHTKECYMFFVKAVLSGGTRIIFSDIKFVEIM